MNAPSNFLGADDPVKRVSEILAAIGKRLLCAATVSRKLRVLQWPEVSNAPLQELAIEGFVNGAFCNMDAITATAYRSLLLDHELSAVGLVRSDLKDLSRSSDFDARIEALAWASSFSRSSLETSVDNPPSRHPQSGDTKPVNLSSWLDHELQEVSPRILKSHKGLLFSLVEIEGVDISGYFALGDGAFPFTLKPYIVASIGMPLEAVRSAVLQDKRLLHPLWALGTGLGRLLVSRNREQLEESIANYVECFELIVQPDNNRQQQ